MNRQMGELLSAFKSVAAAAAGKPSLLLQLLKCDNLPLFFHREQKKPPAVANSRGGRRPLGGLEEWHHVGGPPDRKFGILKRERELKRRGEDPINSDGKKMQPCFCARWRKEADSVPDRQSEEQRTPPLPQCSLAMTVTGQRLLFSFRVEQQISVSGSLFFSLFQVNFLSLLVALARLFVVPKGCSKTMDRTAQS